MSFTRGWAVTIATYLVGAGQIAIAEEAPIFAEAWVVADSRLDRERLRAWPVSFAEGSSPKGLRMIGPLRVFEELAEAGYAVEIARQDHRRSVEATEGYHSLDGMREALESLALENPERVSLIDLGESVQGRTLLGVQIRGDRPWHVRILGGHHGDEGSALELPLTLANALIERDSSELPTVWIVPHVNPDGIAVGSRYNARTVDLNRNYDYQWSSSAAYAGDEQMSEPETRAMRTLSLYRQFASGLALHAGAENIGWPWNYKEADSPDEMILSDQAAQYVNDCDIDGFYGTNGAEWYITTGDTNDWSYGRQGTLDYTLEISRDKMPSAVDLAAYLEVHTAPSLDFVERPPSVLLEIVDAETGAPIQASAKSFAGWKTLAGPDGHIARWLEAGAATLTVEAQGYVTASFELTAVTGETQSFDLALEPNSRIEITPNNRLLSWKDKAIALTFKGWKLSDGLTLFRPGFADVDLEVKGTTAIVLPTDLEPGPWGIATGQWAAHNSLFIGERHDRVRVYGVSWLDTTGTITGEGFGRGSTLYAIAAPDRALRELLLTGETPTELNFDASAMPKGTVDLLVVSNGAQLTVLDATGDATMDTAAPTDTDPVPDTADTGIGLLDVSGGVCGCAIGHGTAYPGLGALWGIFALGWSRGRRKRSLGVSP